MTNPILIKFRKVNKTLKTIFKNEAEKSVVTTNISNNIASNERDVEVLNNVLQLMETHIAGTVIPEFKEQKERFYQKVCKFVASSELKNVQKIAEFWEAVLLSPNLISGNID